MPPWISLHEFDGGGRATQSSHSTQLPTLPLRAYMSREHVWANVGRARQPRSAGTRCEYRSLLFCLISCLVSVEGVSGRGRFVSREKAANCAQSLPRRAEPGGQEAKWQNRTRSCMTDPARGKMVSGQPQVKQREEKNTGTSVVEGTIRE